MEYAFAGMRISIAGWRPDASPSFSPFRVIQGHGIPVKVRVRLVDRIAPYWERLAPAYESGPVIIEAAGDLENRGFRSLWNGAPYAILYEHAPDEKELVIQENETRLIAQEMGLFNHLGLERTMCAHGAWLLHAAFIRTYLGGILFSAPSGTGKSTQAALWERYLDCDIINGDRAAVWDTPRGWVAGGVPWCGSSENSRNETVPLCAVVILRQDTVNAVTIPSVGSRLKQLLQQTAINPWNAGMIAQAQQQLLTLCDEVPVIQFACRPNREAVAMLLAFLEGK